MMSRTQWISAVIIIALFPPFFQTRPYILFANRRDIRLMEITDNKRKAATNIIVRNLEDAAALDYFLDLNQVCWSEINREVIRCAEMDPRSRGKVARNNVVTTGLIKPEGLACDWINNKIYWTDSDTKRIEVAGLSGLDKDRAVLVWENLDLPRAISVDPISGFMFWSDWGEYPKIEKCGMNGDASTRKILVDNDLVWPNGLTLDYATRRLYWVEAQLSYIASVDWDGYNRKTVLIGDKVSLPQPFSISYFQEVLYWSDWDMNTIHYYNQSNSDMGKIKIHHGRLSPMDVKVFEPTRQPPGDSPCRHGNGGCSHICLAAPKPAKYSCKCPRGLKMLNSNTCASSNSEIILLAAREDIIKVSLDTPDHTDMVIPLKSVISSIAIDYDPTLNKVFWTDLAEDKKPAIRSANLDGSEETDVVVSDVNHPDGVAVDWIAGNLFWTDSGTDRIEIARLNGSSRRVLISEDLDEPRSIVLDPVNGWMFWSDWGKQPRIERAWMDGRGREIVIKTDLVWPNGIALDIPRKKLYWCDAKTDRIEVSNMDGSERSVVLDEDIPHPFGLTLLGSYIYWTDWQDKNIQRANKITGKDRVILVPYLDDLMGLKAVSTSPNQDASHPCRSRSCSHLCLMTPEGAICSCPNGYELTADNMTCVVPEAFLLYTRRDDIRRISVETPNTNILIPLKGVEEASALDFDRNNGMLYWSDIKSKTISRAFLNGSNQEILVEFGLDFPEGLTVDWISGNLYWVDAGVGRIEVARMNGSNRKVLLWQNIQNPKSIVVDPLSGTLIWSSWGQIPLIEKSLLDGAGRSNLVEGEGRATGLTIDPAQQRLYWADQDSEQIKYKDLLSPSDKVSILVTGSQPYALTLFQSHLYWTDWKLQTVSKLDLNSPAVTQTVHTGLDYVMDILAFHLTSPHVESPCAAKNCSGLCIVKVVKEKLVASCVCPSHYRLAGDGISCVGPQFFLLFSQRNKISRLLIDPQYPDEVPDIVLPIKRAKAIQSIDFNPLDDMIYWIDQGKREQPSRQIIRRARDTGESNRLGTIEKTDKFVPFDIVIDPYTQLLYWTCENTNSINVTRLAGEELSSLGPLFTGGGNSLPRFLAVDAKQQLLFVSMSGESAGEARIDQINLRTGEHTQLVNSSLAEVTALAVDRGTSTLYWTDRGLKRLEKINLETRERTNLISEGIVEPVGVAVQDSWVYWADRDQASIVRVDKLTGTSRQTILSRVPRLSALISVSHVPAEVLRAHPCNDHEKHGCSYFCSLGLDNRVLCACPVGMALMDDKKTCGSPSCKPNEFTCVGKGPSGEGPMCIPMTWRCDGQPECGDRSDELNCPDCGPAQFRCERGQCVSSLKVCDGIIDCEDSSDEKMCCGENQFQCAVTKKCIGRNKVCDGEPNCEDSSDELPPECELNESSPIGTGSDAATATTSTYLIAVFAALISIFLLCLLVYYCKKRAGANTSSEDQDATRPLASRPSGDVLDFAGTMNGGRGRVIGCDPVISTVSVPSPVDGSSNGLLYDRSHVTGASSTAGTSSSGNYPGPGPPPSPATSVGTRNSKSISGSKRSSAFNVGLPTGYRFYNHRGAPPCTPCSTDINDESDSLAYSALPHRPHFTSRAGSLAPSRTGYDSESYFVEEIQTTYLSELPSLQERGRYAPPPSTPLYLSDYGELETSCAPSPITERSFFLNPGLPGPPPSPVPSPFLDEDS